MKNTKANRTKFLQGYLKILLSWKNKEQSVPKMKEALEELNQSLSKQRKVKLYKRISDLWIHGVKVTQKIVEAPEKLTKKDWQKEDNLEVRRIIQERMGDRFVKELKAKKIQKDKFGELLEIDLKDDPEKMAKYIKVKDSSTSRIYYLRVPPTTKTCKGGVAWTFGLEESEYNPKQET